MSACISVLTGKGYSAIGSIGLCGDSAAELLAGVFTVSDRASCCFTPGQIYHGHIYDSTRVLDEVVVGCEADNLFVIHCHGNPILLQTIAELLTRHGGTLMDTETFYAQSLAGRTDSLLEQEVAVEQCKAVTLEGVRIIQSQMQTGLAAWIRKTQSEMISLSADEIHSECREITARSIIARRIICGVKVVLAGPPNSGKSTLLNAFAGSDKAIVSDTAGTTRDWVSAAVKVGTLRVEMIDTAGLGENALHEKPDNAAQELTRKLLTDCDGIVYVRDPATQDSVCEPFPSGKPVISIVNKTDLLHCNVQDRDPKAIYVSAKTRYNLDRIERAIVACFEAEAFDFSKPVAFTERHYRIIEKISGCSSKQSIAAFLCELNNGQ